MLKDSSSEEDRADSEGDDFVEDGVNALLLAMEDDTTDDEVEVIPEPEYPEWRDECDDECDCDHFDNVRFEGPEIMKYIDWGNLVITKTGMEVLRFMAVVMKGKSMSQNKAEDFLRYPVLPAPLCLLSLPFVFCVF